mmetsp:Transcript_51543/g.117219  ORF Transcript_51543/g.117219 Transcript_51543/m.117219 type:complete len:129 (+) Transcript_51543:196-582(+)
MERTASAKGVAIGAKAKASKSFRPVPGMAKTGPCAAPAVRNAKVTGLWILGAIIAKAKAAMSAASAQAQNAAGAKAGAATNAGNAVAKAVNISAPAQRAMDSAPKGGSVVRRAKEQVKGRARCAMATP